MKEILLIEDEKDIAEAVEYNLTKEGFKVIKAFDGAKGLKAAEEKAPDLVILDLMLPGIDGLQVMKSLKASTKTSAIPVIMLTAKAGELDRVLGLELGADDYITKPFSMRELLARVKTILRRYDPPKEAGAKVLRFSDLEIDEDRHVVKVAGKPVELTAKEFALLKYLADNKERVFDRGKLLDVIWGIEVAVETRTVDVHVRRLREKLKKAGSHIVTLRGVGYKFSSKGEDA